MARETGNVLQQIGAQAALPGGLGTPVAALKQFAGLVVDIGETLETKQYRRRGAKGNTTNVIHKDYATGTFSGPQSYVEIVYPLAGLFPFVGTSQAWVFSPNASGQDLPIIYTLEEGDDIGVEQYSDLMFTSLTMHWTLEEAMMNGNCYAKPINTGLGALSSPAVELAERPVSAREIDVFVDDTYAGIGTTKITDTFEAQFTLGEKFMPKWVLNTSYPTWKEPKEVVPAASLMFLSEHNAQSLALFTSLRSNTRKFIRIQSKGPLISGAVYYLIQVDFCGEVQQFEKVPDADGIWSYRYSFGEIQDATMGRGYQIKVINKLAAL
jgi:hypothetical protein